MFRIGNPKKVLNIRGGLGMRKICAKFQITTPMFLGGADNTKKAELRPTSVKGVLRFWLRAVNYGKYQDYEKVKKVEDELFGSTTSQSKFYLKLGTQKIKSETEQSKCKKLFESGISYLGYGLYDEIEIIENGKKTTKKFHRLYLIPGQTFTVELLINPKYQDKLDIEDLIKPIKALGLFGGLGSRSRRGFGSVTLDSIYVDDQEYWIAPNTRNDLKKAFADFYSSLELSKNIPKYTAYSKNNRTIMIEEFDNYKKALKYVGETMMNFRKNYGEDADIVSNYLKRENVDKHPERVVFGLPHNYMVEGQDVEINAVIGTRRSSPLFIKIISIKGNNGIKYIPVMTVFPSKFLPEGSKISLEGKGKEGIELEPKVSFDLIHKFMDTFPNRLEVRPLD